MTTIIGNTTSYIQHGNNKKPTVFHLFSKNSQEKHKVLVNSPFYKAELRKNFKTGAFLKLTGLLIDATEPKVIFINKERHHEIFFL